MSISKACACSAMIIKHIHFQNYTDFQACKVQVVLAVFVKDKEPALVGELRALVSEVPV